MRQSVASLKQNLEDAEVERFSWIPGNEIVADVFTKQGSDRDSLDEIMSKNVFRHAQTTDNMVICENEEIKIKNLITKAMADKWMRDLAVTLDKVPERTDAWQKYFITLTLQRRRQWTKEILLRISWPDIKQVC